MQKTWNQNDVKQLVNRTFPRPFSVPQLAGAASLCCLLAISGCADSDLPGLQRDAIVEAQQRALAGQQGNTGDGGSQGNDTATPGDTVSNPPGTDPTPLVTAPGSDSGNGSDNDAGNGNSDEPEPPNSIDLEGYELVFNDNFDAESINSEKWNTAFRWGADVVVNNEEQYYIDTLNNPVWGYNPFRVGDDVIAIGAAATPADLLSAANDQPYISGVLTSADKFSFTEGVVEIRAKIPAGNGLWPQFWMLPDEFTGLRPQLFVMEARGDNPSEIFHTYKYQDENDDVQSTGVLLTTGIDFSTDFHTYAVQWNAEQLIFYIDGVEYHRVDSENIASQDMYLIINLAVGGWFPGSPDDTTVLPAEFVIDHVRVFQKI